MQDWSIKELSSLLREKKTSSVEITTDYLASIKKKNPEINAFITVDENRSIAQAKLADERIQKGEGDALTGVPIAQKDIFCAEDWLTTCGSKMLHNFIAPYDATVVKKFNEAGAVNLGKTNMDEFAMGSSNETSYFGAVKNPWDLSRVPGGSSGGSAAAIASRMCPGATATDTGGSIRQPASLCGLTGLKPTYGLVSRYGMIAFASSLDQGGPMAWTAEDCALLLNSMISFDQRDSTSIERAPEDFSRHLADSIKGLKIGVPKEYLGAGLASDVADAVQAALKEYEKLGATLVEISLPKTSLAIPVYYVIAPAEASSNLSRFDGVRYGHRAQNYTDLSDMYCKTRAEGFGDEVKRRILVGAYVLSHGYYDAYYLQAQKIRRLIAQDFQEAFKQCDVIMGPVAPTVAWDLGSKVNDPVANYLADIYTLSTSLAGLPGMSIPVGFGQGEKNSRRPVGLQLIGNYFSEAKLLNIAHQYQLATDWHKQRPTQN